MARGKAALADGAWADAAQAFQQALNLQPEAETAARSWNFLGLAQWKLGNQELATKAFQRASQLDPAHFEAKYNQGQVLLEQGFLHNASQCFESAAALDPTDTRALRMLAEIAERQHDAAGAERHLAEAIQRRPNQAELHAALGLVRVRDQRPLEAEQALKQALECEGTYAPALFSLARLYESQSYEDRARELYEQHREVESRPDWKARSQSALARLGADPAESAQAALASARSEDPNRSPLAKPDAGGNAAAATAAANRGGQPDELLAAAEQAAADGRLQSAVGICLQAAAQAKRRDDAAGVERAYRTATRVAPDNAAVHLALAKHLLEAGQHREAEPVFAKVVDLKPGSVAALLGQAECAIADLDYNTALKALRGAQAAEPEDADVAWKLCELRHNHIHSHPHTRESLELFLKRFPDDARCGTAREWLSALPAETPGADIRMRADASPSTEPKLRHETISVRPVVASHPEGTAVGLATFASAQTLTPAPPRDPYETAAEQLRVGNTDAALNTLEKVAEADPADARAWLALAEIHRSVGRTDLAQTMYYRALRVHPNDIETRYNLGELLLSGGRTPEAMSQFAEVARREPDHAEALYRLGDISRTAYGDKAAAARHFQAFLQCAPDDSRAASVRQWLRAQ